MKKGSKHDPETRKKISNSMKKVWSNQSTDAPKRRIALPGLNIYSTTLSRSDLASRLGKQFGGDRDIYEALGYKAALDFNDYYTKYKRQDIASRIVDAPAQATWRNPPTIWDTEDEEVSPFEAALRQVVRKMKLWHYMERLDRLAGIGRFGVMFFGVRNSTVFESAINEGSLNSPEDLLYLSVFSENRVTIQNFETNPANPRFGLPSIYSLDLSGDAEEGFSIPDAVKNVHWSRIIHVAEHKMEDEIFGTPRLECVYNLLDDLEKIVGGSAEMFWQGAYRGLHINIQPDYQAGDLDDAELTDLESEIQEYVHGITRVIRTQGVDVNPLDAQVADPKNVFEVLVELISGATKIPKRILVGSERGELASAQDEVNWNSRIKERQINYAEVEIVRPFIDRMIYLGILPEPAGGDYNLTWPNLFETDELRKAQTNYAASRSAEKWSNQSILGVKEIRKYYFGVSSELPDDDELPQGTDVGGLDEEGPLEDTDRDSEDGEDSPLTAV